MSNFKAVFERVNQQFLLLAIFFVPFSTALMNVFARLALVSFVLACVFNKEFRATLRFPPSALAISLFALFLLAITWTIAPSNEIWRPIGKYYKLLLIPVGIALAWRDGTLARRAIIWFLAGAMVLGIASYLTWLNLMPASASTWWSVGTADNAVAFKNHITFGILIGFSALICFGYHFYATSARMRFLSIALGVFFTVPIIFLTQGRTGYVAFFIGLIALIVMRARGNLKMLAPGVIGVVLVFAGFYMVSDNLRGRTTQMVSEVQSYSNSVPTSSSAVRISYIRGGLELIGDNPVFGLGTGSFQEGFAPIAKKLWPVEHRFHEARHQPHSEVILIGVQLGAVGWILYFSLFGSLLWSVRKADSFEGDCLAILCVIFATGSIFNSLLWDATEGHWFTLLAGCLYGQVRRPATDTKETSGLATLSAE